ncbi:MAG: hypothetical protein UX25_C0026G0015 [Candidatus Woesebacteria bacterium GW2011_GWC2_45_9]|uniref:Uncharacterized protein n=1 Tax=Candidatus Woesebacteria bacterium GW2011_GWC2_45_9 TaxID=1618589 RepID=A0A0G1N8S9_9BACT|nr:MAG: hypothetical protein UX25_C0026G0015 [Candidatus Woesebacteria bacterium GW2011_GWC2_45_9]
MSISSLEFGDIFVYMGKYYVFLACNENTWFMGLILNKQLSETFLKLYHTSLAKNKTGLQSQKAFCFSELQTEELRGRVLHLGKTDYEPPEKLPEKLPITLCKKDLIEIKKEILKKGSPVPKILIEYISPINLES